MPNQLLALAPYGADERVTALFDSYAAPDLVPGRVVRVDRDRCLVVTPRGQLAAFADRLPAVGDWVALASSSASDRFVVREVLPRWSELSRGAVGSTRGVQVVAANVDVVFVVSGLDRDVSLNRIERELALACDGGAQPVVVLNKQDRSTDPAATLREVRARLGVVDVVLTNAADGTGVDALARELRPNRTGVLLGASGVGKSTLANSLIAGADLATGAVREHDGRGRHTTTARYLLPVPGGGVLIDTPGVRSLGMAVAEEGVALAFPEIEELSRACRFRDCQHEREPGCAVVAAVGSGELDDDRFESWRKLQRELAYEARTADPKLAAEETRRWKTIHKEVRGRSRP